MMIAQWEDGFGRTVRSRVYATFFGDEGGEYVVVKVPIHRGQFEYVTYARDGVELMRIAESPLD